MQKLKNNLTGLLCLLLTFLSQEAAATNYEQGYYENQLYVMLGKKLAPTIIDGNGAIKMGAFNRYFSTALPFEKIQSVTAPFFVAEASVLQQVLLITFKAPVDAIEVWIDSLRKNDAIVYVEKVPLKTSHNIYEPNDLQADMMNGQWYLHKIQAPEAWHISQGSRNITVAVVDNAVDITHPDLKNIIWINEHEIPDNGIDDDGNGYIDDMHGFDLSDNGPDPSPIDNLHDHGTHVAGLACAQSDNDIGIASIGFNVSLMGIKAAADGDPIIAYGYRGILYAVAAGADMINCSWGSHYPSNTENQVVQYALSRGCLIFSTAGNEGVDAKRYPAAYPGVIAVGSTSPVDQVSTFSNYGDWLSVFAPGQNILSTYLNGTYVVRSGTSMACPIVAGLAALMKSHHPEISNDALKNCLFSSADSIVFHDEKYRGKTGAGRINAFRALQCVDHLKKEITGLGERSRSSRSLTVYPNPATDQITINYSVKPGREALITITDLLGKTEILKQDKATYSGINTLSLHLNKFAAGLYVIELNDGVSKSRTKFIKH